MTKDVFMKSSMSHFERPVMTNHLSYTARVEWGF